MRKLKSASGENKSGFTLIELSLSLVFIGILSLAVAFIISDTIGSYRRGLMLSQVNTIGMDLVDDMRSAIQNSSAKPVTDMCGVIYGSTGKEMPKCIGDGAKGFVSVSRKENVDFGSRGSMKNVPIFGAFCSGSYSYIWNSGYLFDSKAKIGNKPAMESAVKIKYKYNGNDKEKSGFRLLKIRDESRAVCVVANSAGYGAIPSLALDIAEIDISEEPVDLLETNELDGGFALYDLYASAPAEDATKSNLFYSVSFILGTVQGGVNIKKSGGFCATPDEHEDENFDYCAINKFNFAAQAFGGK